MASNQGRGTRKSSTGTSGRKSTASGRKSGNTTAVERNMRNEPMDTAIRNEILLIACLALAVILFLCNFGIVGKVGNAVSSFMFGVFGLFAYVAPVFIFLAIAFRMSNIGNNIATRKLIAGIIVIFILCMIFELISVKYTEADTYQIAEIYKRCSEKRNGGGVIAGSAAFALYKLLGMAGTVIAMIVVGIICAVIVTEKSFIGGVKSQGKKVYERSVEDAEYRRERARLRREAMEERRAKERELKKQQEEEKENEKILRMDKKVSGVMIDTALSSSNPAKEYEEAGKVRDDIHEITLNEEPDYEEPVIRISESHRFMENQAAGHSYDVREDMQRENKQDYAQNYASDDISEIHMEDEAYTYEENEEAGNVNEAFSRQDIAIHKEGMSTGTSYRERPVAKLAEKKDTSDNAEKTETVSASTPQPKASRQYHFPPYNRLAKGKGRNGNNSDRELKETAIRLQQTLGTFGVKVTVTDISQGPSVTRYELQPEQGVKVSKIVGLADDIKLNLAATDIRIEAPIPGKAAVGIEVPNKEVLGVALRDLLESDEFKNFPSKLAFAVGKDIAGKTVVADIAKMPHMLIAGATGSGKSVCINTIIMGILYKAHPDDVKLIMIDPKVVELSVYNGIPHLLIPVVTDPKKAAAALHWGVAEMTERYKKFADYNVRDLAGYNKKVESMKASGDADAPEKMPQILIIVDELADLMMVSPGEVEESICRLAQLARACGIHLIIATQRPSVDVITGLIKANMPSRVAFAVSSGVDSRTILDMVGAEKLLGKGDMLFYPQGYPKPARIQGAFVSDKEVSDVVDFLKNQEIGNVYDEDVEEKIKNMGSSVSEGNAGGVDAASEYDQYFAEAGRFIIEKDKASIGMLQRAFKIGFNRAARIMDQLCDAGVVGEEEGTKPRKILLSMAEFEQLVEEIL
ncbi:MAG: DNA translocase FtsK [Clostridiales bacterium]|nr:DNA translocase FtsK [Clostridiales bacterium]